MSIDYQEIASQVTRILEAKDDYRHIRMVTYVFLLLEKLRETTEKAGPTNAYIFNNVPPDKYDYSDAESYRRYKAHVETRDKIISDGFREMNTLRDCLLTDMFGKK